MIRSACADWNDKWVEADYKYSHTEVHRDPLGRLHAVPKETTLRFRTELAVPRVGLMLVGLGGNNGSTVAAGIIANKKNLVWRTRTGEKHANWFGSLLLGSTMKLGVDAETGAPVHIPMNCVVPMLNPNDLVISGWDISKAKLGDAMKRAMVLDVGIQDQLYEEMQTIQPLPGLYNPDFIASNQKDRADNLIGGSPQSQMEQIRKDIREFKASQKLDKVIILWTATTERFSDLQEGVHDTAANLLQAVNNGCSEVSPSTIFAIASILEGCSYINGSPQNTCVPGVIELAEQHKVFIGGDDFKSGQTKLKSVIVDFLISAGLKPTSIVSYNHLGNNDGRNLSSPAQFRSKEISKSTVVDDMVGSNSILYKEGEVPDHCVVIKYVPAVGDSKRAMDEYTSEIFMGGTNTLVVHNTCEDSLLAVPIIIDLVLLTELCQRIEIAPRQGPVEALKWEKFHPVLSLLSYLCKAPMVPPKMHVVNALFPQRAAIVNVLRACVGLPADDHMSLEARVPSMMQDREEAGRAHMQKDNCKASQTGECATRGTVSNGSVST